MWWSRQDRYASFRGPAAAALLVGMALALSACGFTPLYGGTDSQAISPVENPFSVSNAGAMALVLNQTVKASTMATDKKASIRQRRGCSGVMVSGVDGSWSIESS